jgi:hypothetical protein
MSAGYGLRSTMRPVSRRVRAYFAPVVAGAPVIFDPAKSGVFDLDSPPTGWTDLGWIANFKRTPETKIVALHAGAKGETSAAYRQNLGAHVEFDFAEWGKLQMALAGGSQHMNVLAADPNSDAVGSGGSAMTPVALAANSTAQEIVLGPGAVNAFAVGDVVAVDADYAQQIGYVGTGIPAAYVNDPLDVLRDRDYVRRVTFNVGSVAQKTATSLILARPLLGGAPLAGSAAQKVIAFVDREGGSFFQQWSALFVVEPESGGRICFHYPLLKTAAPASEGSVSVQKFFECATLHATFEALAVTDLNDSERVLCFRSYFPATSAATY